MGLPQRPSSAPGRRSSMASTGTRNSQVASSSSSQFRARSPILAWAKRSGVEHLTPLQQAYISACENLMPPVAPELAVLETLARKRLELNLDTQSKDALKALAKFLESDECRRRLLAVRFAAGGEVGAGTLSRRSSRTAASAAPEKSAALLTKVMVALGRLLSKAEAMHDLALNGVSLIPSIDLRAITSGLCKNVKLSSISFRDTVLGDEGMKELAPALSASRLNLIDLSNTGLSSASAFDVARVIKAHGGRRDEALWSASLRGRTVSRGDRVGTDIAGQGLLLLDLSRNSLTGHAHAVMAAAIEGDSWLLGLRMAPPPGGCAVGMQHARTMILNPALVALVLTDDNKSSNLQATTTRPQEEPEPEEAELLRTLTGRPWPCVTMLPLVASALRDWRTQNENSLRGAAEATGSEEARGSPTGEGRAQEMGQPALLRAQLPAHSPVGRGSKAGATSLTKDRQHSQGERRHSLSRVAGSLISQKDTRRKDGAVARRPVSATVTSSSSLDRRFLNHDLPSKTARPLSADVARAKVPSARPPRRVASEPTARAAASQRTGPSLPPSARSKQVVSTKVSTSRQSPAARSYPQNASAGTRGSSLHKPGSAGCGVSIGSDAMGNAETTELIQQLVTRMGHMTKQVMGLESTLALWREEQQHKQQKLQDEAEVEETLIMDPSGDTVEETRAKLVEAISKNVHRRLKDIWDL